MRELSAKLTEGENFWQRQLKLLSRLRFQIVMIFKFILQNRIFVCKGNIIYVAVFYHLSLRIADLNIVSNKKGAVILRQPLIFLLKLKVFLFILFADFKLRLSEPFNRFAITLSGGL